MIANKKAAYRSPFYCFSLFLPRPHIEHVDCAHHAHDQHARNCPCTVKYGIFSEAAEDEQDRR